MFAQERSRRSRYNINIAPLIDVLFLLLIFFMVSSTFIEKPGIDLSLPQAKTSEMQRAENIIITLDTLGALYVNGEKIEQSQLRNKLMEMRLKKNEDAIVLEADENIPYKHVVFVMDTARDIGFNSIVALTTAVADEK